MKREATIHRVNRFGNRTVCGVPLFRGKVIKTHKTYKGVTCANCLKVRSKNARLDQQAKDARYMKRKSNTKCGTGSMNAAREAGYS